MDGCEFVGERTRDNYSTIYYSNFATSRGWGSIYVSSIPKIQTKYVLSELGKNSRWYSSQLEITKYKILVLNVDIRMDLIFKLQK